jgi:hypothetical protein
VPPRRLASNFGIAGNLGVALLSTHLRREIMSISMMPPRARCVPTSVRTGTATHPEKFAHADPYGWSEDKARQTAEPEGAPFATYVKKTWLSI